MNYEERKAIFDEEVKPHIPQVLYDKMLSGGFLTQAASKKYHGAYSGGLFDHSLAVMRNLVELTEKLGLKWQRPESPYIVGIAHDMCKIDAYIQDISGNFVWNKNQSYSNVMHGVKSVLILRDILGDGYLTDEEESCIAYHMGAFMGELHWDKFTQGIKQFPNVLWTHTADMEASHIQNI